MDYKKKCAICKQKVIIKSNTNQLICSYCKISKLKKPKIKEFSWFDWFTEDGKLVIKDGKVVRKIKEGTILVSYGRMMRK